MSVEKIQRDLTNLFNYPSDPNPTTQADYINAVKNWVGSIVNLVDCGLWQPETAYSVGNIAKTPSLPSQYILVCTEAGDSGVVEPDYTGVSVGDTVVDGTVTWLVSTIANGGNIDVLTTAVAENTADIAALTTRFNKIPFEGNAGFHNSLYRGANLGAEPTAEQWAAILAGTFDDLFIGDYWKKNVTFTYYSAATDTLADSSKTYYADTAGTELEEQPEEGTDISELKYCVANTKTMSITFRIADFDYYYNIGDTNFTRHHVVIVPDENLYNAQMHITNTGGYVAGAVNTTEGGYVATDLFKGLVAVEDVAKSAFGETHVASHRVLLPTTATGEKYTGWAWQTRIVDIMTEQMVYGSRAWGAPNNNGYSVASQKTQLNLFRLAPAMINRRYYYWLQDISSSVYFCNVHYGGFASDNVASYSYGVRPAFLII